jgi:ABC-type Mn2+/Zn2+ transport system ATPase subunit
LVVGYGKRPLSSPLTLSLPAGDNLGIIGGNGTGKTTLVKTLLGLIPAMAGSCSWKKGLQIGYVPQESQVDTLVPLTVEDLLKMGIMGVLPRFRQRNARTKAAVGRVLEEMEIPHLAPSLVRELSSGERQRALLGRAWISRPQALVLDEPFNFLDYFFKEKFWKQLSQWRRDHDFSMILIDHDLNRIINEVQWLVVLGPHETLCGSAAEVVRADVLSRAYGAPLHVHQEDGHLQVHFL